MKALGMIFVVLASVAASSVVHADLPASQPDALRSSYSAVSFVYDRHFADIETFAADAPAVAPVDPIAKVNGEPISRERLTQLLFEAYGKRVLESVMALEVVKQRARERKISVSPADIADEETRCTPPEILKVDPKDRDRVLDDYLERNSLTRVDWRLTMERRAYMRKLLSDMPEPQEKDLRELFNRINGEKVEISHIQVRTPAEMAEVNRRLAKNERFELVAKDLSQNKTTAAKGGRLEPFDRNDPGVPKEIREVAFDGLTEPGDISGDINAGGNIHRIQLIGRIPPSNAKFEDERGKLAAMVRERWINMRMAIDLRTLVPAANIEVLDPILKQQWTAPKVEHPDSGVLPRGGAGK